MSKELQETMKASFSDITVARDQNGEYHFEDIEVLAAGATDQTQPLNVEDDVDAGVPRDKSVGLEQTEADYLEYEQKYERGKGNTDDKVIPRSKGDSGISGWEKTTFDDEGANKATSGDPDNYVQSFQENVEPSKAGTPENHAAEDGTELKVTAEDDFQKLSERVEQLEKDLQKEKTLRSREFIASKIVGIEKVAGLISISEDEADERIRNMASQTPVDSLKRELERTKSLVAKLQSDGQLVQTSSVKTGVFSGLNDQSMPALQTMFVSSDVHEDKKHLPKSYLTQANSNSQLESLRQATQGTYLNRIIKS